MPTLFYKGDPNQAMEVMDSDIAYWQGQGFTTSKASPTVAPASTPTSGSQTSTTVAPTQSSSSVKKKFYRIGQDIFDASTNQRIGSTDWNANWSGRATEVSAPSQSSSTSTSATSTTSSPTQTTTTTTPPAGATLISGPSGLNGLTEKDIWRDPSTNQIYRLNNQTATSSTTAPSATTATPDTAWIDAEYQKAFDRPATAAEKANWVALSPEQLGAWLKLEQKRYGYTPIADRTKQEQAQADAFAAVDADPNLTLEQKNLLKATVSAYQGGVNVDSAAILKTFNEMKDTVIDPYYSKLIDATTNQLKANMTELEQNRAVEMEKQDIAAGKAVTDAQASLEASGLSRTGEGVKQLGTEGALTAVERQPFGGLNADGVPAVEGSVPTSNRLIATSTLNTFNQNKRAQGLAGEKLLGSGVTSVLPEYSATGIPTGTIEQNRQTELNTALTSTIANQDKKNKYNANADITV